MAQAPTSKSPATSAGPFSADLKAKLAASQSSTIYVPLEGDAQPTDDELKTLAADGLHVEYDSVRDALAVRAATDDEIAEASAPTETKATPASSASSSSTSSA